MNNTTLQLKFKQRLNKVDSNDYDNVECWQVVEAFNKAQLEWVRRQIHGSNNFQEGDEGSKMRIDDLQILLKPESIDCNKRALFYESKLELPKDYLYYKKVEVQATNECCQGEHPLMVFLAEEDNSIALLHDNLRKPSFEWRTTFVTLASNKLRVYTNDDFQIDNVTLTYYRKPLYIEIAGCNDPYTLTTPLIDKECEFKDDIVELLIDEAVAIFAGDIESGFQYSRGVQNSERNN